MQKRIISSDKAPQAVGPYSQAVEKNGILYISGQLGINPETNQLVDGGIKEQTLQVLKNVQTIIHEAGYELGDVVKATCLLADIKDFKAMNEVYAQFFTSNPPARAAFAVKDLPLGAQIEIETIAIK